MDIFVGNIKPMGNYVLVAASGLVKDGEIIIKARGSAISRAVDLAEILKRQHNPKYDITIGTVEMDDKKTSRKVNVSTIEIKMIKQ